jgi:hypothetical protein
MVLIDGWEPRARCTPLSGVPNHSRREVMQPGRAFQPPRNSPTLPLSESGAAGLAPGAPSVPLEQLRHIGGIGRTCTLQL